MKNLFRTARWLMTLCALTGVLRADEFIADQQNEPGGSLPFYVIGSFFSIGQEFTPNTNSLSFVDLVTHGPGGSETANLQVSIRLGTISGSVLGVSDLVLATNSTVVSTNRFSFLPPVQFAPGQTYVLQVGTVGTEFWSVAAGSDAYSRGRMIRSGQPDASSDLWFREGYVIPAPDSAQLSVRISHLTVSWSSSTGKTYQVQYRSDLTTNIWVNLGSPVPGNGLTNCVLDEIANPKRFYRVITLLP